MIDPPWENRSVKRARSYEQLPGRNLLTLPVAQLLSSVRMPEGQLCCYSGEARAAPRRGAIEGWGAQDQACMLVLFTLRWSGRVTKEGGGVLRVLDPGLTA